MSEHKPSKTEMPETKLRPRRGAARTARTATRDRAKPRKDSKDPKTHWLTQNPICFAIACLLDYAKKTP